MKRCPHCGQPMPEEAKTDSPIVVEIPLIASQGSYPVSQADVDRWQEIYPAVDVLRCLRHIAEWNGNNTGRRKTRKGILNHITSWLARDQDKGGGPFKRTPGSQSRVSQTTQRNMSVAQEWLEKRNAEAGRS